MKLIKSKKLLWLMAALIFVSGCSGSSGAKKEVERYLGALKSGDFATLYELNATTQKKVALIYRGSESTRDEALKTNFEEYKVMFADAEPDPKLHGLWSEKFLFPSDSTYTVTDVVVEEQKNQGTTRFKERMVATAEIKVEYKSKESAPELVGGQVKSATYIASFINGYDVVNGIKRKDEIKISEWLFKSVYPKKGEVIYW